MPDLSSQPTPLQTIYNWYRNGTLIVNRRYQRKLVWSLAEKQKLIDSVLNEYPIPLVLLAESKDESTSAYEIIDGLQRLHTIVSFIEHGFPTIDEKYFNVDEFTRAKEERENNEFIEKKDVNLISRSDVARILDYILPVSIIRNVTQSDVTDVFGRINSYGHRLSDQERRQAGLSSDFAQFVRRTACEIRGDVSVDTLPLYQMPEISVDLPMTRYGYRVQADDVFWVRHGILRSTDLRDSLDEQVIADITGCIVSDRLIERSKDTLDAIYDQSTPESAAVNSRFSSYGPDKILSEFKYVIEVVEKIVAASTEKSLRSLVFETKSTNAFPTVFSSIFIAIHELTFSEGLVLANPDGASKALANVHGRLNTRRDALGPDERRNNVNLIKGLITDCFVNGDVSQVAYGVRRELDIENTLRRSRIETPSFEMKQGIVRLDNSRSTDANVVDKVLETICAIANIGPKSNGAVFVGVADDEADATRIELLDKISAVEISGRYIVGIDREAKLLSITPEQYYQIWRDGISNSDLSEPLRSEVLSNLDLCLFRSVHILIVSIPSQKGISLKDGKVFIRDGDQTIEASPEKIVSLSSRFTSQ